MGLLLPLVAASALALEEFTPAIEVRLTSTVVALTRAKREAWRQRMDQEIQEMAKVTGLSEEDARALKKPADSAVDACLQDWPPKVEAAFRQLYGPLDDTVKERGFESFTKNATQVVNSRFAADIVHPWNHPDWLAAVRRTLNPAQRAVWSAAVKLKSLQLNNTAPRLVKTWAEAQEAGTSRPLIAMAQEVSRLLSLPPARAEKLTRLATAACEKRLQAVQDLGEKALRSDDSPSLQQFSHDSWDLTRMQSITSAGVNWADALDGVLSPAEIQTYKDWKKEHRRRASEALGEMLVATIDAAVALTSKQREAFRPVALRVVQESDLPWRPDGWIKRPIYDQLFQLLGRKVADADKKMILDGAQWRHWTAVFDAPRPAFPSDSSKPPPAEPSEAEAELSDLLYKAAERQRYGYLLQATLCAEDVARTSALSPAAASRLSTAARRVVEQKMERWRTSFEQSIRLTIAQQPIRPREEFFRQNFQYPIQREQIEPLGGIDAWKKTVETILPPAERLAWQKEVDARNAFRATSATRLILVIFESVHPVSFSQYAALEPLLHKIKEANEPHLARSMGVAPTLPWITLGNSPFVYFAAFEDELKSILTKEQWEEWTGSPDYQAAQNAWKRVKQQKAEPGRAAIRG